MELDFKSAAMEFARKHNFSMPIQAVEAAMREGAEMAAKTATEAIRKARIQLEESRAKNLRG